MEDNSPPSLPVPEQSVVQKLFDEALMILSGPRRATYGPPSEVFATIADFWQTYLRATHNNTIEINIQPTDVAMLLTLLKITRLARGPTHHDSLVDIVGYAGCYAELIE